MTSIFRKATTKDSIIDFPSVLSARISPEVTTQHISFNYRMLIDQEGTLKFNDDEQKNEVACTLKISGY